MKTIRLNTLFFPVLLVLAAYSGCINATQLAPPKFQVTDEFGINVPTGQATVKVDTLSIGGEMGLSHSVASHTNNFLMKGGFYTVGLNDKFGGSARYEQIAKPNTEYVQYLLGCSQNCDYAFGFYVLRVFDHEGSMDFKIMIGGYAHAYVNDLKSGYSYEALGDTRHTLVVPPDQPGYLVWTKPDGTQVWYVRASNNSAVSASAGGFLQKIVYPNGFTLTLSRLIGDHTVLGVNTNTGFQLKYNYVEDRSPNQGIGAGLNNVSIPAENTLNWSLNNPKTVVGINRAIEYCSNELIRICMPAQAPCPSVSGTVTCTRLANKWPVATFNWPVGMPRAFHVGESHFSIIDSSNRTSRFRIKAFDTAINEQGQAMTGVPAGTDFIPRLVGVKPANASSETVTYSYKNHFGYDEGQILYAFTVPRETGHIDSASGMEGSQHYIPGARGWSPGSNPHAWATAGHRLHVVQRSDLFGAYYSIKDSDGEIQFEDNYRNFPKLRINNNGPEESYKYDARGNLTKIIYNEGRPDQTFVEAKFPDTCKNIKTCNQAEWIADQKGNKTFFTYHEESGQVASITYPPNKNNLRPQTRFFYTQLYAKAYGSTGVKELEKTPIWMKTEERYCINSEMNNGGCNGGDEIVTRYEYQHDNLLLTGKTVMDAGGDVRRSCYTYDIYGNQIGETQPKAQLGSCN